MKKSDDKAVLIVFEGLDGAGKTTCARALAKAIGAQYMTTPTPEVRNVQAVVLNSLGDCQEARQLFYLATVFGASGRVREALAHGISVVMDRYFLSTQVYAELRGSGLDLDKLGDRLVPAALTVYLDASLPVRRARLASRDCSPADRETLTLKANSQLRTLYLQKAALPVAGRFIHLINDTESSEEIIVSVMREIAIERESAHDGVTGVCTR